MPERYVGRTLGRFRIESLVGSGGFAWVYKGYDPELEIPVAIKVLKPQFAGDDTFESRFRREASIAARLRHPNIIRILAVGREDGAVYFVMDYLPNSLVERLKTMGALPEPLLIRLGIEVASALAFAHREGVVHRDVKADNILFDDHGNAVVADFGIARAVSGYVQETGTNMVVGTPQYFSPEQARGLPLDGRADLYSLGITLFRAATGRLPFDGEDWYDIARQHVEERPPKPRTLAPGLTAEMERIILRCLAKSPDDRFPNGEAVVEALAALAPAATDPAMARTLEVARITPAAHGGAGLVRYAEHPWLRRGVVTLGLGVTVALLGVALVRQAGGPDGAPGAAEGAVPPPRDSTPTLPALTVSGAPDSAAGREDPGAVYATLRVSAPDSAAVAVDGRSAGTGSQRLERLSAGSHTVTAHLPNPDDCGVATASRSVTLAPGEEASVALVVQRCGHLELSVTPPVATVTLSAPGAPPRTGPANRVSREHLPPATYRLIVSAEGCLDYDEAGIRIDAGRTERRTVKLVCSSGS